MNRYGEHLRRILTREEMDEEYEMDFIKWSPNSDYVTVLLTGRFTFNRTSEIWKVTLNGEKTIVILV